MLLTSSGDRETEEVRGAAVASAGRVAAAAFAATIPGARLARGTLRGRPALVVCTEAVWSEGAVGGTSTGAGGGWAGRSWRARRGVGGGGAGGGEEAPGVLVGSGPAAEGVPVRGPPAEGA